LKNGGLDSLIVATNYKETLVQRMIKHLKYNFVEEFAEALAKLLILQISENGHKFFTDKTVVIPVPLHRRRFLERGFNQTGLIADRIAAHYGLTVELGVVDRAKKTKPQFGLDREARTENVAGAFVVVDPDKINNCDALIVDDILTTGATLNELARALKSAGARRVIGLAVAHE
jgi:ComF family protein